MTSDEIIERYQRKTGEIFSNSFYETFARFKVAVVISRSTFVT